VHIINTQKKIIFRKSNVSKILEERGHPDGYQRNMTPIFLKVHRSKTQKNIKFTKSNDSKIIEERGRLPKKCIEPADVAHMAESLLLIGRSRTLTLRMTLISNISASGFNGNCQ
jgi:hypothetical protein